MTEGALLPIITPTAASRIMREMGIPEIAEWGAITLEYKDKARRYYHSRRGRGSRILGTQSGLLPLAQTWPARLRGYRLQVFGTFELPPSNPPYLRTPPSTFELSASDRRELVIWFQGVTSPKTKLWLEAVTKPRHDLAVSIRGLQIEGASDSIDDLTAAWEGRHILFQTTPHGPQVGESAAWSREDFLYYLHMAVKALPANKKPRATDLVIEMGLGRATFYKYVKTHAIDVSAEIRVARNQLPNTSEHMQ